MENRDQLSPQEAKIQDLLSRYLSLRVKDGSGDPGPHIEQDSLSAFVEGSLSERESGPIVGHLVRCSFCRHVTTELVRLDLAFAETMPEAETVESAQPSKISEVLSSVLGRLFGASEAAVFAHEERKEEEEKTEEPEQSDKEQ
jgi:hypothetical protein